MLREAQEALERAAAAERKAAELEAARKAAIAAVKAGGGGKDPSPRAKTKAWMKEKVSGMFSRRAARTAPTPTSARATFENAEARPSPPTGAYSPDAKASRVMNARRAAR